MTDTEYQLSFPPSSERLVLGLFRPTQVLWLLGGVTAGLFSVTSLPMPAGIAVALVALGLAASLCVLRLNGAPVEEVLIGLWWLAISKLQRRRRPRETHHHHFVATIHHPDRFLEAPGAQWQTTSAIGEAIAACAQAMKAEVQLLSIRRSLLSDSLQEALGGDEATHPYVSVLVAPADEKHRSHREVLLQTLRDTGAQVALGQVVQSPVLEFGRIRRPQLASCRTSLGEISVQVLRAGPALPLAPTGLLELFIDPPWDLFAVTVSPASSASLHRRIERRQTAALADAELLERKGFRRSAAQDREAERRGNYEASIAGGERAALVYVHSACVGADAAALGTLRNALLSASDRMGLRCSPLVGRHHLGCQLFGAPEVLRG